MAFDFNALEPTIGAMTMEIHYTKHAAGYAKNLNEAKGEEKVNTNKFLEDILSKISSYSTKMRNNGGGYYNHELFWKVMSPKGVRKPEGDLATVIDSFFGSYYAFV